jgi:hypothetical protein
MHSTAEVQRRVELQHINVKLLLQNAEGDDLDPVIPVFHNWIQDQVFDELLVDVADYRHVPGGPGVVLIGHEADYSVDNTDNRLGVRYNRKAVLDGDNQQRLRQAVLSALRACRRLEEDRRLNGRLLFNGLDIDIFINDRLLAPNSEPTRVAADPDLRTFFKKLFAGSDYSLSYTSDPRKLFGASIRSSQPFSTTVLLKNLT